MSLTQHLFTEDNQLTWLAAQIYTSPDYTRWDVKAIQNAEFAKGFSQSQIEKVLITEFGGLEIHPDYLWVSKSQPNTLNLVEFHKHYEFGKFTSALAWIKYFLDLGFHCDRQQLFRYILMSNGTEGKPKSNKVRYGVNVY